MKNSLNLVLGVLLLLVIGCSCQKIRELSEKAQSKSMPVPTPVSANTSSSPLTEPSETENATLRMAQYNQIKDGMPKSEVQNIIGSKGTEISSSSGGGFTFSVYQWKDKDYSSITLTFKNDKVMTKSQYGLK